MYIYNIYIYIYIGTMPRPMADVFSFCILVLKNTKIMYFICFHEKFTKFAALLARLATFYMKTDKIHNFSVFLTLKMQKEKKRLP